MNNSSVMDKANVYFPGIGGQLKGTLDLPMEVNSKMQASEALAVEKSKR